MSLWSRLFGADATRAIDERRWVVLDVETTGLDPHHDVLLAIAAVAVTFDGAATTPRIALHDSFEAVLHHDSASTDKDNILVHGIGVGAQRAGAPPRDVLAAFERWAGRSPLLAFHAAFDRTMIERAMKTELHRVPDNPWLDLDPVARALHPGLGARALDDWLDHFGIVCAVRHQAVADTLATAELLLRLWPAARRQHCATFAGLAALALQQRWLSA
jgi:DNA polymerase III subunit epsilon